MPGWTRFCRRRAGWAWLLWAPLLVTSAAAQPSFEAFRALYDYDATQPLNPTLEPVAGVTNFDSYKLRFSSANQQTVTALYGEPKGEGPFPALLLLHGYGGSKKDFQMLLPLVVPMGVAVLAYDAPLHGDRAIAGRDMFDLDMPQESMEAAIQTAIDGRRAVDFLATRPKVDPKRIAFAGASMGAILGSILCAVEERISCGALLVGGANWELILRGSQLELAQEVRKKLTNQQITELAQAMAPIDPLYFVGHISPRPVLFQFGTRDDVVPPAANQAMFDAAGQPKDVDWYDSGHFLPIDKTAARVLEWLGVKLGLFGQPQAGG